MSDYLPWDITIGILSRLPVKSLMRFKCVSKSFNHLISHDADFKKRHCDESKSVRAIICSRNEIDCVISCHISSLASGKLENKDVIRHDVPIQVEGPTFLMRNIYNFCDGLLCMRDTMSGGVLIWNPHTRESKRISDCSSHDRYYVRSYALAYDSISNDYKVLGVITFRDVPSRELQRRFGIYSLRMDSSWRLSSDLFPYKYMLTYGIVALANGAFHWLGRDSKDLPIELASFDMTNEKFRVVALPEPLCWDLHKQIPILFVLSEKLCFSTTSRYDVTLWMMEEYSDVQSIRKKFSIPVDVFCNVVPRPFYLFEDGTIITNELGTGKDHVHVYKDGRFVRTSSFGGCDALYAFIGKETLISPHMSNNQSCHSRKEDVSV